jgi:hypothetical protein
MNELAQPIGLTLIAIAIGAATLFAARGRFDPRWGRLAVLVLVVMLIALVGLVAYSVFLSPFD